MHSNGYILSVNLMIHSILFACIQLMYSECPPKEILDPCVCDNNTLIVECNDNDLTDLKSLWLNASQYTRGTTFEYLIINNSQITELEDNGFAGVRFKNIIIKNAKRLSRIGSRAFSGSEESLEYLHHEGWSQLIKDEYVGDLFTALNSLINARGVSLTLFQLTSIPSYAFNNSEQQQLDMINININSYREGSITTVMDYAFYKLANLQWIYLSKQAINHIESHAFDFEEPSNDTLQIMLANNQLNSQSFPVGVFMNSRRPVEIDLTDNYIAYLNETVFLPFLLNDRRNTINLLLNKLTCDCNMFWLVQRKMLRKQVYNALCYPTNNDIFDTNASEYRHCI